MTFTSPTPYKYGKRWGFIRLNADIIKEIEKEGCVVDGRTWKEVSELMRRIFIVESRPNYANDSVMYMCLSPLFNKVNEGEEIPEYEAWFETCREDGMDIVKFVKFEKITTVVRRNNLRW